MVPCKNLNAYVVKGGEQSQVYLGAHLKNRKPFAICDLYKI